jgi:predicted component of type VI protein secretion system
LSTGDEANPMEDAEINFRSIKDFNPDEIMDALPLLRNLKEQQNVITRLEQLMQEGTFAKIVTDSSKKDALVGFLKSVLAEIDEN